jgi:regulator of replication initiation timing
MPNITWPINLAHETPATQGGLERAIDSLTWRLEATITEGMRIFREAHNLRERIDELKHVLEEMPSEEEEEFKYREDGKGKAKAGKKKRGGK